MGYYSYPKLKPTLAFISLSIRMSTTKVFQFQCNYKAQGEIHKCNSKNLTWIWPAPVLNGKRMREGEDNTKEQGKKGSCISSHEQDIS